MACDSNGSCISSINCTLLRGQPLVIYPITRPTSESHTVIQWNVVSVLSSVGIDIDSGSISSLDSKIQFNYHGDSAGVTENWEDLYAWGDDTGMAIDSVAKLRGTEFNLYYRLVVRINDADLYYSKPQRAIDHVPANMASIYREVIRRWYEDCKAGGNRQGYLLKKLAYGAYCENCRDRDGKHQIKSQCSTCYDVGFDPGYIQVPGCFFVKAGPTIRSEASTDLGTVRAEATTEFTWLNVPEVYAGDVFVDHYTDERFIIGGQITTMTRVGGCELKRKATAVRLDAKSVIYKFPVIRPD